MSISIGIGIGIGIGISVGVRIGIGIGIRIRVRISFSIRIRNNDEMIRCECGAKGFDLFCSSLSEHPTFPRTGHFLLTPPSRHRTNTLPLYNTDEHGKEQIFYKAFQCPEPN